MPMCARVQMEEFDPEKDLSGAIYFIWMGIQEFVC